MSKHGSLFYPEPGEAHYFYAMAHLKFSADQLFTGMQMLDDSYVLITNPEGIVQEVILKTEAGDNVQKVNGILSPGFINCHCHLELSHMKALIPEKTGLIDFVFKVVTQRHFNADEIEAAIIHTEQEMLQNGIVAVGDICNNSSTFNQKAKHHLHYYNFIETSGWLPSAAATRFERAKNLYDQPIHDSPFTIYHSIVPHAPYSVSENLWQLIQPYFKNKTVSIHNQETSFEDELFSQGSGDFVRMYELMKLDNSHFKSSGKSSLQTYFSKLAAAANIILVHNTFTKEEDILYAQKKAAIQQQQLFWCLCVNANQYIEDALPPVNLLRSNDCNIVLGTDSLASNHSLNILDEINTICKNIPELPVEEILQWATLNGAKALQMDDKLGSFEKGKQPGVNLISEDLKTVRRLI